MSVLEEFNGTMTEYEYQKRQERKRKRKANVVKERDKEWLEMIDNVLDAIWFETAKSVIPKSKAIGIIRDIAQLFTEYHDVYETNCTHYDKTFIIDGFILHSERERMEYYIEEALKGVKVEIEEQIDRYDDRNISEYEDCLAIIDRKIAEVTKNERS